MSAEIIAGILSPCWFHNLMSQDLWLAGSGAEPVLQKTECGFAKTEFEVMNTATLNLSLLGIPVCLSTTPGCSQTRGGFPSRWVQA